MASSILECNLSKEQIAAQYEKIEQQEIKMAKIKALEKAIEVEQNMIKSIADEDADQKQKWDKMRELERDVADKQVELKFMLNYEDYGIEEKKKVIAEKKKDKPQQPKQQQEVIAQQTQTNAVVANTFQPNTYQQQTNTAMVNDGKIDASTIASRFIRQPMYQQPVVYQQPQVIPATIVQQQPPALQYIQPTIPIQTPVRLHPDGCNCSQCASNNITPADLANNLTKNNNKQQQPKYNKNMSMVDKANWLRQHIVTQGLDVTDHQLDILHEVLTGKLVRRRCKEWKEDRNQKWIQDQSLLSYDTTNDGYNFAMSKAVFNDPYHRILVMIRLEDTVDEDANGNPVMTGYPLFVSLIDVQPR